MEIEKTLRLLDPHTHWGNHEESYYKSELNKADLINNQVPDTGLCNRLLHWECGYYILNQPEHKDFKILLQKKIWPELEIISLPKSYIIDYNKTEYQFQSYYKYDELHFKTVYDITNQSVRLASALETDRFKKVIKGLDTLKDDNHWYSNFEFMTLDDFSGIKKRFLGNIKLKHTEVSEHIEKKYKDYVGIHIRRGNGVNYTEDDIKTLPVEIQDKYREYREKFATKKEVTYHFTPDSFYFNIIEHFIKKNPSQKFYISHDLDDVFIQHYYKKFGHHVIESKYNNRYFYEHYYANAGVNVTHLKHYSNGVDNIIDLFTLSNCGMVIGSAHSTWSEFSRDYKQKPYNDTSDALDRIFYNYENHITSKKSLV